MSIADSAARTASDISLTRRLSLRSADSFLVDPVFPNNAIHAINGPPDIGKTTWSFQWLYDWSRGNPVFGGCKSNPCKWGYLSIDRGLRDTDRTLRRIGLGNWDIPAWSIEEVIIRNSQRKIDAEPTMDNILNHPNFRDCKMLFIEGLQMLIPNVGRGQSINKAHGMFMMKLRDEVERRQITIIFVNHTPKGGFDGHDREGGLGSQGLIGQLGTVISFALPPSEKDGKGQVMSGEQQTSNRLISVMMKNSPPMYLRYSRSENGGFELDGRTDAKPDTPQSVVFETKSDQLRILDFHLFSFEGGTELPLKQIHKWGADAGISLEIMSEWALGKVRDGRLVKEGRGYRRTTIN